MSNLDATLKLLRERIRSLESREEKIQAIIAAWKKSVYKNSLSDDAMRLLALMAVDVLVVEYRRWSDPIGPGDRPWASTWKLSYRDNDPGRR
jgi:hypothetical protein